MNVRDIMTRDVIALLPTAPIVEVAQAMRQLNVSWLPLVSNGQLVGLITDHDIVIRVVADGLDPHLETAQQHMTQTPVCAEPDWSLERAAAIMTMYQIQRLPVTENGQLVGCLTLGDLAAQQDNFQPRVLVEYAIEHAALKERSHTA